MEPPSGYDGDALGRGWNHRWNRRKGTGGLWPAASVFAGASVLPAADSLGSGKAAAEPEGSGDDLLDRARVLACDERHFVSRGFGKRAGACDACAGAARRAVFVGRQLSAEAQKKPDAWHQGFLDAWKRGKLEPDAPLCR